MPYVHPVVRDDDPTEPLDFGDVVLVEPNYLAVIDVHPGDVVVVRGGPVICGVPVDPGPCEPEPEPERCNGACGCIDLSSLDGPPDVPADHGAGDKPEPRIPFAERLRVLLDEFWHEPDADEHGGDSVRTVIHSGLPPHWHDTFGGIRWFSCLDELGDDLADRLTDSFGRYTHRPR